MYTIPLETFKHNLKKINARIEDACDRSARDPHEVKIMAVTKTFPASYVEIAQKGGIKLFGENKIQEARTKYREISNDMELHLIGHLQRNKAKLAAQIFSWVESIDKYETAAALHKNAELLDKTINILIEINTTSEESKFGLSGLEKYWELCEKLFELPRLTLRGLMTVGPFTHDKSAIGASFSALRDLFIETKEKYPGLLFDTLSMGMSGDYDIAVEHGSTLVRIGTALFGERSYF
ncbi:MAG: YggS family pyridoxal phosphate-dependent enzyme [Spirochaetales bacterium]|nr:YggS family pyridoxal phosphate-dependent enzyme [Spirochaetales bacterium]